VDLPLKYLECIRNLYPQKKKEIDQLFRKLEAVPFEKNEVVFIYEEDPFLFSSLFLFLIEKKAIPAVLSKKVNSNREGRYYWEHGEIKQYPNRPLLSQYTRSFVTYTSGSTGESKQYFHSIESAFLNAQMHGSSFEIGSDTLIVQTLPMFHIFGIIAYIFTPLCFQCKIELNQSFYGVKDILLHRDQKKKLVHLIPSQCHGLEKNLPIGLERIDQLSIGAGFLTERIAKLLLKHVAKKLFVTYGLTEAGPRVTCGVVTEVFQHSYVGRPLKGISVKIFDKNTLKSEGVGLLAIQSSTLSLNLDKSLFHQEYLITQDVVKLTEHNDIYLISRNSDIIKFRGVNIYAQELIKVINSISFIQESFISQKNASDESIIICLETNEENINKIKQELSKVIPILSRYAQIKTFKKFPRTALGKIDRKRLLPHS